jgi:addiction module RelE/StbE family toxin
VRVRWLRSGLRSLQKVSAFIAADNPLAASRVINTVHDRAALLAANPKLGRAGRFPGTRELILGDLPFIIVYRLTRDELQILRLLHTSQEFP